MPSLAIAVASYAAMVVGLTWPLAYHVRTHLPDTWWGARFDPLAITWAMAHVSRVLLPPGGSANASIFHPSPNALFYTEAGFGAVPYFLPTYALTENPTLAVNLVFLGGVTLTATALHFVVYKWTASHMAGFIAAWTFLTTRWVLWTWLPVAPNYAILHYLPLILFLAASRNASARTLAALLVLVVLQGLVSPYLAAATIAPLLTIALARLCSAEARRAGARLFGVISLSLAVLLFAYLGYVRTRVGDGRLSAQSAWSEHTSYAIPLPAGWFASDAAMAVPPVAIGLIALGALAMLWQSRSERGALRNAWCHGLAWTVTGLVVSLTPTIDWSGTRMTLPHQALSNVLPIYEIVRFPQRLAVVSLIGLSVLTGLAFAQATVLLRRRIATTSLRVAASLVAGLLVSLVMFAQYAGRYGAPRLAAAKPLPSAYPLWRPVEPGSRVVAHLRRFGGPLLELPVGPTERAVTSNDAPLQARAVYRALFHGQPVLNGYGSYWPPEFAERMAAARRLPDSAAVAELRDTAGLKYVLVHLRWFGAIERELCRRLARQRRTAERCNEPFGEAERAVWRSLAVAGGRGDLRLVLWDRDDLLFSLGSR